MTPCSPPVHLSCTIEERKAVVCEERRSQYGGLKARGVGNGGLCGQVPLRSGGLCFWGPEARGRRLQFLPFLPSLSLPSLLLPALPSPPRGVRVSSPGKRKVRGLSPGKIWEFYLVVG